MKRERCMMFVMVMQWVLFGAAVVMWALMMRADATGMIWLFGGLALVAAAGAATVADRRKGGRP